MFARLTRILAAALLIAGAAAAASAQGRYRISPGDTLQIEVLEDSSLNRSATVLPDGTIDFPLAGTVDVAGRTVAEVRSTLSNVLAPNFAAEPTVFASVSSLAREGEATEARMMPTYITGAVANSGRIEVEPGTTILQLLAQAGGPTPFAADSRIQLRRTDPETGRVNTYLFSYSGTARGPRIRGSTRLAPGDVVVVPERGLFEFD